MKRTRVIMVRHGETTWNSEKGWQGHLDSPLTPNGLGQARALAKRLASVKFSALYSSDLNRAYQTAQIIAAATGHNVTRDRRLRERNLGTFQGLTREEIRSAHADEYELYRARHPDHVLPGGESLRQQVERNVACFEALAQEHNGESIVVVTHGGVLSGLLRHVLSIPLEAPRRFAFPNSSLNVFIFREGDWMLQTWARNDPSGRRDGLISLRRPSLRFLYGGENGATTNKLWSLDLKTPTWRNMTSSDVPRRESHSAVYHSRAKRMVVFGGTRPRLIRSL